MYLRLKMRFNKLSGLNGFRKFSIVAKFIFSNIRFSDVAAQFCCIFVEQ